MNTAIKFALALLALTLCGSIVASILHARQLAVWLGAPALIASGWAAFGHFITLNDELPGGWSNPENSRSIWYRSLGELLAKLLAFGVVLWVVVFWPP